MPEVFQMMKLQRTMLLLLPLMLLPLCGMLLAQAETCEHVAYCSDLYHCVKCGASVDAKKDPSILQHPKDGWYPVEGHEDYYHYHGCACGKYYDGWVKHTAYCDSPDTCRYCGMVSDNSDGWNVNHRTNAATTYGHNASGHWYTCPGCKQRVDSSHVVKEYTTNANYHTGTCTLCGEKVKAAHQVNCQNPTTCVDCKATGINGLFV